MKNVHAEGVMMMSFFYRPSVGGLETHLDDLCNFLSTTGHHVFVVTFQPLTNPQNGKIFEKGENLNVYRVPTPLHNMFYRFESRTLLRYLILMPFLLAVSLVVLVLHRKEIDVIHCHDLNSAALCAFVSWLFGKRSVITVHYVQDFLLASSISAFNKFGRRVISHFDAVIAISSKVSEKLAPLLNNKARLHTMTYWIDLSLFQPAGRSEIRISKHFEGHFIILFVGRLVYTKGVEIILDVAARLKDEKDIEFLFIGQGPLSGIVQTASDSLQNVRFLGPMASRALSEYYRSADLLLVPSTYEEGFGRVIMEAIASGLPVIGANRGAIPEAMDSTVGCIVEPTVAALEQTILEMHSDRDKLSHLASSCRKYAEGRYSIKNVATVLEAYAWEQ